MSLGRRRPKHLRAHLRSTSSALDTQGERNARRRARWLRVGVVAIAILATAAIVHGTGTPFPYRIGQRPTRELRVSVPSFKVKNQRKTIAEIQQAADRVLPILDNDPAPIGELAERLLDLADAVAKAPDLMALPENARASWGLDVATFDELRAASDTPERRDDLRRRILLAFDPLRDHGILGPDTLPPQEEAALGAEIHPVKTDARPGKTEPPNLVGIDRIKPERVVKPDGPVARDFIAVFPNAQLGQRLFHLIDEKLAATPTLSYNEHATSVARKTARDSVRDVYDSYERGNLLVEQDTPITEDHLELLRMEHRQANVNQASAARIRRAAAVLVLVGALFALIGYYIHRHEPRLGGSLAQIVLLCTLVVATMGIARLLALQPWDAELIPIALAAMILAIAYNPHFALMVSFAFCLLMSLSLGSGIAHFIVLMGGTAAGVLLLNDVRSRTKPIQVGLVAAAGYFVLTWATGLWLNQPLPLVTSDSLWRAGWGLMAGFFLGGLLPLVESTFGIVTGISLLELGDISHPLLQELVRRAPGTHNHSVTVATIAESAAERIGANSLLLRVGAYFHDIGKMLKPHYFIENQMGAPNRHANLAPAMSTLIIIGHVKDGVDLARQHNLPEPIVDLIEQHHGTTLVEYFYREAKNRSEASADGTCVHESAFRYPGPRPQTREAGILMLADAVESASRTLSDPTPGRIEGLVSSLVEKRLYDGQFDECGLTLREITEIRESLIKSLIGIYHGRVKYPEQKSA
jgi:putative nucleotidyltransferase with HDIG domain